MLMSDSPVIQVKNATVYLGGKVILKDINWQLKAGAHHFILGANGAGKTTLVKMLMGYAWPLYGAQIQVLGHTYGQVNLAELRKQIAWVSPFMQQWTSPDWTALEMVISGLDGTLGLFRKFTDEEEAAALQVLSQLDAVKLRDRKLHNLSSGEQVKVLIARSLMTAPRLMILDEASVYLDITSREYLLNNIEAMARTIPGLTILFITQRIEDITPVFTRGMILSHGQIVAEGERDEVLTEKNLADAFNLNIKLVRNAAGRFWPIIE